MKEPRRGEVWQRPSLPSSAEELEALIRRVVREEFDALLERSRIEMKLEDEALADDAIAILEADRDRPEAWISWEEVKVQAAAGDRRVVVDGS